MTRRHIIAVAVAVACMLVALLPAVWVRATGNEVALALRPVDPLSLFRGNYVDLDYDIDATPPASAEFGDTVYVVFDASRPANATAVTDSTPVLDLGEVCVRGRVESGGVHFPELEQFFVTADQGAILERNIADMVGVVRATDSCRAVLVAIEPE